MTDTFSHFVMTFLVFMIACCKDTIHAEEEMGFDYEYETATAMVPEVNIAIDRVTLIDPADKWINITDSGIAISAKIRIGSFLETGYVIGDRNWRFTFWAANSTNHRLSDEFPAKLTKKQQAMDLLTASTLTFDNVKGELYLGSLDCSTFSRICFKIYDDDEALWVKGERSFDVACTNINCNRAAPSRIISYLLLWMSLQATWMHIIG